MMSSLEHLDDIIREHNYSEKNKIGIRKRDEFMCKELVITDGLVYDIVIPSLVLF